MTNTQTTHPAQRLAELHDERSRRYDAVMATKHTLVSAAARLSALRGQAELDGVNLDDRIALVTQQIEDAERVVNDWPDTAGELDRRIAQAQAEIDDAKRAELRAEYDALVATIKPKRIAHAQAILVTATHAKDLMGTLVQANKVARDLAGMGVTVPQVPTDLGNWPRTMGSYVDLTTQAERWLQRVEADTWNGSQLPRLN